MDSIITVSNLAKNYYLDETVVEILKDISLSIGRGEFISIVGPSGSGKSTLMHILGLLDRPTEGKYFFRGRDTGALSDDELARIRNSELGFIFQSFNLLNRTTVLENVKLPLAYADAATKRTGDARARQLIESVGLSHRLDNWPSQLSGGEQQRVAIARALMNNPAVIFADEPTGNLDSKSGGQVMKLLHDLHEQGHTVVMVTHDPDIAAQAERIIHIRDGQITADERTRRA